MGGTARVRARDRVRTARLRAIRVRLDVTHCHDDASIVGLLTELRVHLVRVTVRARVRVRARARARARAGLGPMPPSEP